MTATTGGHNTLTDAERKAGWRLLFDGRSAEAWRGFRMDELPQSWQVDDGTLHCRGGGRDIITREQFEDFELALQWKHVEVGNSGIFFGVSEECEQVWHTGPEMQIINNDKLSAKATELHKVGANYDLHAPAADVARPVGEWNDVFIRVHQRKVELHLNGVCTVAYELFSEDWNQRVANSKFKDYPYGQHTRGHLALQDHGDPVWFRNIRIRTL